MAKWYFQLRFRVKERTSLTRAVWLNFGVGLKVRPLDKTDISGTERDLDDRLRTELGLVLLL